MELEDGDPEVLKGGCDFEEEGEVEVLLGRKGAPGVSLGYGFVCSG